MPDAVQPTTGVNFNHPCMGKIHIVDADKGIVDEYCPDGTTPRKKVAIVGYAETSRMLAPFDDPEWSIWGMNQIYRLLPREDRHFDIHHNWDEHVVDGTDHVGWITQSKIPVYMVDRMPQFQASVRLPIEKLIALNEKDYFTSSIAFMMALAIAEGFTHIRLYGIDLIVGDEWDYQKPCAEFWIGVALGRGITVGIPDESALCKQMWRYGYESQPTSLIKMTEINERKQHLLNLRQKAIVELANVDGALQDCEMFHELGLLRSRGSKVIFKQG